MPSSRFRVSLFQPLRLAAYAMGLSLFAGSFALLAPAARAETFKLNATVVNSFYISATNLTVRSGEVVNYDHLLDGGGDAFGSRGTQTAGTYISSYCVGLTDTIYLNNTYNNTTITNNGVTFGETIQNGGKISWLMTNFASAAASNADKQKALQAAIWRTEYGSGFELDGADNTKTGNNAATITAYKSYIALLGNNTSAVSNVLWISAAKSATQTGNPPNPPAGGHYQALVGIQLSTGVIPEPGTITLFVTGGLPLAGAFTARKRRKRSV